MKGQQAVTFMAEGGGETQTPGFMSPVFRVLTKNCLGTSHVGISSVLCILSFVFTSILAVMFIVICYLYCNLI